MRLENGIARLVSKVVKNGLVRLVSEGVENGQEVENWLVKQVSEN